MLDKQKDIDGDRRRDAGSHARGDRVGGDGRRQARLRAEAAVLVGARSAAPGEEGAGQSEGRHADGQPGPLAWTARARGYEYLTGGAIGDVREVHVWTNRPLGYWPQGIPRPAPLAGGNPDKPLALEQSTASTRDSPPRWSATTRCPTSCSWDLFLGVAPDVEYHPIYHPFNWRGWVDWGQGALGDMGAHLIDHPFWSLEPRACRRRSKRSRRRSTARPIRPRRRRTTSSRRAGACRPVKLTWYDGGFNPPKPEEIGDETAERRRRHPLHRQQGQDAAGHLRRTTRACCRSRCTNRYGAPKQKLPRIAARRSTR